jgi:N-acetylneuraminic acid mutarotase
MHAVLMHVVAFALLALRGPFAPAPAIAAEAQGGSVSGSASGDAPVATIRWDGALPALPRPLSGHVMGISGETLIVAGGTDFPISLFQGGAKVWYDDVYALPPGASAWIRQTVKWPHPIGYAGVVSTSDGVIVAGGSDGQHHTTEVWLIRWTGGAVQREPLPPLPSPIAMGGATAIGRTVFVVGGQESPNAKSALATVWALDLAQSPRRWRSIEPLPGPARILPVVAGQAGRLIVASGAELITRPDGTTSRRYLADAFAWTPSRGWQAIAAPPRPVVAAPSVAWEQSHVFVLGGDDGAHAERVQELREAHPGFSRTLLAYHVITDTWAPIGTLPAGLVTTTAVRHGDKVIIAGGEDRPGHRVANVRTGTAVSRARVIR